jgi:predicted transglutaminase-like cysteine proteinase
MARIGLILLALALAGCASPEAFMPGAVMQAPRGWVDYCSRHPTDPDCKGISK